MVYENKPEVTINERAYPKYLPKQDLFGLLEDIIWVNKETNN